MEYFSDNGNLTKSYSPVAITWRFIWTQN